jgi:glycosyltransferase involved in cell wall biosynthesis
VIRERQITDSLCRLKRAGRRREQDRHRQQRSPRQPIWFVASFRGGVLMRVLIATDAWHPQVNGVVRTLTSLAESAAGLGVTIDFLTPEGFPSVALPTYASLRVALPGGREIARRIAARVPIPASVSYAVLRRFHSSAVVTMVSTGSLMAELRARGFRNLRLWTRGVDTDLFAPERAIRLNLPRPIFLTAGRVAVEKNLAAFLALDLPGSKVVVGEGPQETELRRRFPQAAFLGLRKGPELAGLIAAADVFVFPSLTDTFGVVQLEALACGVPVAAFPVTGPKDVIAGHGVGVLDEDLRAACLGALQVSRAACRTFALTHSWTTSARQFSGHLSQLVPVPSRRVYAARPVPASAQG